MRTLTLSLHAPVPTPDAGATICIDGLAPASFHWAVACPWSPWLSLPFLAKTTFT